MAVHVIKSCYSFLKHSVTRHRKEINPGCAQADRPLVIPPPSWSPRSGRSVPQQLRGASPCALAPLCLAWVRSRRCADLGANFMVTLSAVAYPLCRPEAEPFLLREPTLRSVQGIMLHRRGMPVRRTRTQQPHDKKRSPCWKRRCWPRSNRAWNGWMSWMSGCWPSRR